MKKQINPTIKAHLIRGAFYLLLLLAVCAIPFALAERNTTKRSLTVTRPAVRPYFAAAVHGRKPFGPKTARLLRSLLPNSVYMLDDGSAEDAVGFGDGATNSQALWMNHFDVISGQTMISTISVAWGTPVNPDPSLNGMPVTIAVWSDPNGDGDPTDGLLLGSVAGTVQNAGTDTFVDYTFNPPIDVSAFTSFFVGDMTPSSTDVERFFQGIDETPPSQMQSWIAANGDGSDVDINTIANNDLIGTIDSFGLPGNWLIRADTGGGGTPTPTPTGTPSPTPTPTCQVTYTTATSTGTITAGGTDIGNHCDDCFTQIDLPFPVNVYGAPTSVAFPASNGDLHLANPTLKSFYYMQCVPVDPSPDGPWTNTLFPFYDDLLTMDGPFQTCSDCGIFTQTVGKPPNRQFIIRWKTVYFNNAGNAEFEVILTEGSDTLSVIYGDTSGDNGATAASGIQQDLSVFTSFSCFGDVPLTEGLRVDYIPAGCGSPTPTPTATATPTPTATAAPRQTPSPRPRPTPVPRP